MPKMTSEQIDAMVAGDDEQLIRTVLAYQQREYANLLNGVPKDMQIEMIRNGIAKARSYGLQRTANINAFVALMFEIAPEFDHQPDIQRVLKDPAIAPENKIQALMDRVPAQAWEDAGKNISSQTWFPELRDEKD